MGNSTSSPVNGCVRLSQLRSCKLQKGQKVFIGVLDDSVTLVDVHNMPILVDMDFAVQSVVTVKFVNCDILVLPGFTQRISKLTLVDCTVSTTLGPCVEREREDAVADISCVWAETVAIFGKQDVVFFLNDAVQIVETNLRLQRAPAKCERLTTTSTNADVQAQNALSFSQVVRARSAAEEHIAKKPKVF